MKNLNSRLENLEKKLGKKDLMLVLCDPGESIEDAIKRQGLTGLERYQRVIGVVTGIPHMRGQDGRKNNL